MESEIDRLEKPLREAHALDGGMLTFQTFVDWVRNNYHPLRATAIAYNRAVYEMQKALR